MPMLFNVLWHCDLAGTHCGQFLSKKKLVNVSLRVKVSEYENVVRSVEEVGKNGVVWWGRVVRKRGRSGRKEDFRQNCSKRPSFSPNFQNKFCKGVTPRNYSRLKL